MEVEAEKLGVELIFTDPLWDSDLLVWLSVGSVASTNFDTNNWRRKVNGANFLVYP